MITLEYLDQSGTVIETLDIDSLEHADGVMKYVLSDERHTLEWPHIVSVKLTNNENGRWQVWKHTPGEGATLAESGEAQAQALGGNFEAFKAKYGAGGKGGYKL